MDSLLDSALYRLLRQIGAHRARMAAALAEHGLHIGQELMLAQLWREDGLSQVELATRLGVSAPAVTKVVRGLEESGFVTRQSDDADGRVLQVRLTDGGRALEAPVTASWYEVEAQWLAALEDRDRADVLGIANRRKT